MMKSDQPNDDASTHEEGIPLQPEPQGDHASEEADEVNAFPSADDDLADLAEAVSDVSTSTYDGSIDLPLDENERLDSDLNCLACDYNLRGQRVSGACPECGTPVSHSMRSDHLRAADIGWLRSLKTGFLWLIIGTFTAIALAMLVAGIEAALSMTQTPPLNQPSPSAAAPHSSRITAIAYLIVVIIQSAMAIYAYWKLTEPEPGRARQSIACGITRWATAVGYTISVAAAIAVLPLTRVATLISELLDGASGLAMLVAFPAFLLYLRSLARRIPSDSLAKQTMIVMWGMIACIGAVIPLAIVFVFVASSGAGPGGVMVVALLLVCPILLGFLVLMIWWIVLLFVFHSKISQIIDHIHFDHRAEPIAPEEAFGPISN